MIYLDYAAATPVDQRVLAAMMPFFRDTFANPGSLHTPGREAKTALDRARRDIAMILAAKPAEIIFTSGSTEGANLAIQGVARAFPEGEIVATAIEHEAVLDPIAALEAGGRTTHIIGVDERGVVQPQGVAEAINDRTVLVCVQYANNEIGTIQPLAAIGKEIARLRADRRARGIDLPLYFYCDAAQAGLLSLQVNRLGVDLLSMGGSKLYGPPGSGFLYARTGMRLEPLVYGGKQESGQRSGTPNVAAAVGLATALKLIQESRDNESRRLSELVQKAWKSIGDLEGAGLNGGIKSRLPGNLNFRIEGISGETLVAYLDAAGFAVATGSACTAANQEPSHVLLSLGLSREQAESSLRVTAGRFTNEADLTSFGTALQQAIQQIRSLS